MSKTSPQRSISLTAWALLGCLTLIWAGSFTSNRIALAEVGVFSTVAFRVAGGALVLWTYIRLRGLPVPGGRRWIGSSLIMGLFNNVIPFCLIVWGQTRIDSGLAAILNGSTAIFAVSLAAIVFPDERMTLQKGLGVALGFAGVVVAIGIGTLQKLDLTSLAQLAVVGASLSYAAASTFAREAMRGVRPEVSAAAMLTCAALVMVPMALWFEGAPSLDYQPATWLALGYLAVVASALAYLLYYTVLTLAGSGNLSLVTLTIAPVAIGLGALIFGEVLAPAAFVGFGLLALGLLLIDGRLPRAIFRVNSGAAAGKRR